MVKIEKNYGYMGPGDGNQRYYMTEGQYMSGQTIGIMQLDAWLPFLPGNVSNADTFDFPVRYLHVLVQTRRECTQAMTAFSPR